MGGGDLNSKKSWHPNTMKNQERVWKAEQAAAQEKKRIMELQHERAQERDRAELNDLMTKHNTSIANENRLSWMYDKPDKKVDQEEYLLGKSIDKNSGQADKPEQDAIPAVGRRVVGSSMLATSGDTQVDLVRKIREDPLLLIKERERAARAALLNNPLQRRRLTELLRKEQDQRMESKIKKKSKKKDKDLDDMLAAKLNALGGKQGINLATLLNSDNSSSDSSSEEEKSVKNKKKKKSEKVKKKKSKKAKKNKRQSSSDSDSSVNEKKEKRRQDKKSKQMSAHVSDTEHTSKPKKRKSDDYTEGDNAIKMKRSKYDGSERRANTEYERNSYYDRKEESRDRTYRRSRDRDRRVKEVDRRERDTSFARSSPREGDRAAKEVDPSDKKRRGGLSEEEKAARLAEMVAAGAEREVQRGRRVAQQRAADAAAEAVPYAARGPLKNEARSLPESLESRIHSNRHYIQRDKRHMNEHFARRE